VLVAGGGYPTRALQIAELYCGRLCCYGRDPKSAAPLRKELSETQHNNRSQDGMNNGLVVTAGAHQSSSVGVIERLYSAAASLDRVGMVLLRSGMVVVLVWIGGLKFANYEADSIVPLVANSPAMSFFYHRPAPEYRRYMNREGELIPSHRQWHVTNGTYAFAHGLGVVIILIGLLIAVHPFLPQAAAVGSVLLALMACTTLSFLVTTPEAWVPALGDTAQGFPYLSGVGRLIIKDAIMLGAAILTLADSAKAYLRRSPGER
jgi:reactive chlorine resistance protein C